MSVDPSTRPARSYGNWRRPASGGLLGLGSLGTGVLMGGLLLAMLVGAFGGLWAGAAVMVVLVIFVVMVVYRDAHGLSPAARVGARMAWFKSKRKQGNVYRSGPLGQTPWSTFQLPGLGASLKVSEATDSYGRPFALIHAPAAGTYQVVIGAEARGSSLVDQSEIDVWVAQWGAYLANLSEEIGVEGLEVTIESAPASGYALRSRVVGRRSTEASEFSNDVIEDTLLAAPLGASTIKAFVTVTFSAAARPGGKPRKPEEMAAELAVRIGGLTGALEQAGVSAARPLSAQKLMETIMVAYNPTAAPVIDQIYADGDTPEMSWLDVGPSSADTFWDGYKHDSGISCTWQMTVAPRGTVQSNVLERLLAPASGIDRKRVSLLYRPINAARAASIVEADVNNASFNATQKRRASARDTLAVRSAMATSQEEASGAGLENFGMLITATVTDEERIPDMKATVNNLAATARLRIRPVYGSQDSAFIAALPLGLILSKHVFVPSAVRERL